PISAWTTRRPPPQRSHVGRVPSRRAQQSLHTAAVMTVGAVGLDSPACHGRTGDASATVARNWTLSAPCDSGEASHVLQWASCGATGPASRRVGPLPAPALFTRLCLIFERPATGELAGTGSARNNHGRNALNECEPQRQSAPAAAAPRRRPEGERAAAAARAGPGRAPRRQLVGQCTEKLRALPGAGARGGAERRCRRDGELLSARRALLPRDAGALCLSAAAPQVRA